MSNINLARYIDHTLLKQDARAQQILTLCHEAKTHNFASVCVNPYWVRFAKEQLKDSEVQVATVVGFPLGASTTAIKEAETKDAIKNGATEIDMVINIGELKSNKKSVILHDISTVVKAAGDQAIVKVIIETSFLTEEEKITACQIAMKAGAHFVKTSTGFSDFGARLADIRLMKQVVGNQLGIKASAGIRDRKTAEEMIAAGASRIGTSAGVQIVSS